MTDDSSDDSTGEQSCDYCSVNESTAYYLASTDAIPATDVPVCGHHADALEAGEWDGNEWEISLNPATCEEYETRHGVRGKIPAWAHVTYSATSTGSVAHGGWDLTTQTVEDVDAELACICGEEFTAEQDAIDHVDDVGAETLTVLETPNGDMEVVDRADPVAEA